MARFRRLIPRREIPAGLEGFQPKWYPLFLDHFLDAAKSMSIGNILAQAHGFNNVIRQGIVEMRQDKIGRIIAAPLAK